MGALAVAFAIHRANVAHATSGGSTSVDVWQSKSRGFWHAIEPYGAIDLVNGWPSSVPETSGWKKALAHFTGYNTVAEFYEAFEAFVSPLGVVASEDSLLSILESDANVNAMSLESVSLRSAYVGNTPFEPASFLGGCRGESCGQICRLLFNQTVH